jgi:hypothetical protein
VPIINDRPKREVRQKNTYNTQKLQKWVTRTRSKILKINKYIQYDEKDTEKISDK